MMWEMLEENGWECFEEKEEGLLKVYRRGLTNEYGHGFGYSYLIFSTAPRFAEEWEHENLWDDDGKPYWENRGLWEQIRITRISYVEWLRMKPADRTNLIR